MIVPVYFQPYEDELLYSWICRLAKANGLTLFRFRHYYLGERNLVQNDSEIFSGMFWKGKRWPDFPDMKDILFKHTGYWAERVLRKEYRVARDIHQLLYDRGDTLYDIPGRRQRAFLRVCPECLKEDRQKGRDFYFKTWHSFENVKVCCRHGCALFELKEFPGRMTIDAKKLEPEDNALEIAKAMYNLYQNPFSVDPEIEKIFCKKKFHMTEDMDTDQLILIHDYKGLCEVECKVCGTRFFITPYATKAGRDCPVCELKQDIPKKMLAKVPGYELVKDIRSLTEGDCIRHVDCGQIRRKMSISRLVWNGSRCHCEQLMTKEKMYKKYSLDGFEILDFWKNENNEWVVRLMHKECGYIFETRIYTWSKINCPGCNPLTESKSTISKRQNYQKRFDKRIKELTGDEYIRVGEYRNASEPVDMLHRKCGGIFPCSPMHFYMGQRCRCDSEQITQEQVEEYLRSFEQSFTILKKSRKLDGRYHIRFNDTGKVVKLTPRQIRQEATCLCEPEYFKRDKGKKAIAINSLLNPRERFEMQVRNLTGDEYILVGEYKGNKNKVNLQHTKCGGLLSCYPHNFLNGQRCRCDSELLTRERIYQYLNMFEQNFVILKKPSRDDKSYTIQFNDTGKIVKMREALIKQEATCLCEPKYFKRKTADYPMKNQKTES